jgi:hypothetical protein
MAERTYGSLTKDVVTTIVLHTEDVHQDCLNGLGRPVHHTIHNDIRKVMISYFGGKTALFFTIDQADPVVLGDDCFICLTGQTVEVPSTSPHEAIVKMITGDTQGMYGVGVCKS